MFYIDKVIPEWYDLVERGAMSMYTGYVVVSVKMPKELKEKIDRLAKGKGETRNGWILKRLAREARWGVAPKG